MATIRAVRGKKSTNYEVRIRRKGVSRSRVFKTRLAAEEYGMRVEADMLGDKYVADNPLADQTLGTLLTRYSTSKTPKKKGARQEQGRIKQLLAHPISARSLHSLGSADFADFRDEMEADDYAPSTINKFLFLISGVYVTALGEWGFDARGLVNPITNIDKCAVDPSGSGRRISPKEEKTILDLLDTDMQDLVGLALETAGRRSELVLLKWNQINLSARCMTFYKTKSGKPRTVPLSRRATELLSKRKRSGVRVFDMHVDTATFRMHEAWQAAKRVIREEALAKDDTATIAELDDAQNITFHTTRHEATSRLIDAGMHFHMVQRVTGHSTAQMLNRYYHAYVRDILSEMDRIDAAQTPPPDKPAAVIPPHKVDLPANVIPMIRTARK